MKTRYYIDEKESLVIIDYDKIVDYAKRNKVQAGSIDILADSDNISHKQRMYFFGLIVDKIYNEFIRRGNDEVTKSIVKKFLHSQWLHTEEFCPITGKYEKHDISLSNSSKGLDKETFNEKKLLIQKWGAEKMGIDIPDPDPNWRMSK